METSPPVSGGLHWHIAALARHLKKLAEASCWARRMLAYYYRSSQLAELLQVEESVDKDRSSK
jgi:hypothetical protein